MKKILSVFLSLILVFSLTSVAFAAETETELPFENSSFFEIGDYTLHYRTYPAETQEKGQIMLLHGFGLSSVSFEGLAAEYAENGYRVVTVDLPNFGYSSRETKKTELVDREELVFALMQSLGGEWILGGHSMGGGIAINIANEHPESISALFLFAPQTSAEIDFPLSLVVTSPAVLSIFEVLIALGSRIPSVIRKLVEMSFSDAEYAGQYDVSKIAKPLQIKGTGRGIAIMASHARATDLEKFSSLSVPVVIVTAENDKIAMADNLNAIISAAPETAGTVTFSEGGHMMMEYSPKAVCQATLNLI
ncbi:MAG: alpha/beta fold hydrolase [Acutalibacteraceae bacterium]